MRIINQSMAYKFMISGLKNTWRNKHSNFNEFSPLINNIKSMIYGIKFDIIKFSYYFTKVELLWQLIE